MVSQAKLVQDSELNAEHRDTIVPEAEPPRPPRPIVLEARPS